MLIAARIPMRKFWPLCPIANNCFSTAEVAVQKDLLMKLRRKTGYPFHNCKEALQQFGDNIAEAEKWLNDRAVKEGWMKSATLSSRLAAQGLIGVLARENVATIIEVNCETDFVARNQKFRDLVSSIVQSCLDIGKARFPLADQYDKWNLDLSDVSNRSTVDGKMKVADLMAFATGQLSEKLQLKRALCIAARDGVHLAGYSHPRSDVSSESGVLMGQYGTLLAFVMPPEEEHSMSPDVFGQYLCQHIVGMNPKNLGTPLTDEDREQIQKEAQADAERKQSNEQLFNEAELAAFGMKKPPPPKTVKSDQDQEPEQCETKLRDETQLLRQDFLLCPEITVGDYVKSQNCTILDFVRFGCGDTAVAAEEA